MASSNSLTPTAIPWPAAASPSIFREPALQRPLGKILAQTIANTNPINLDIAGSAIIYGAGCYREVVKDSASNTIFDQPTCDTSSTNLIWAGTSSGSINSQSLTASNFSQADGQTISFIAGLSNTGATTLVVNGGTPINVLRDTASGSFSLAGGEIVATNSVQVVYDATRGAFHLVNNPATGSSPMSTLSASGTTDLGSASSRLVKITGSASITSFGSSASIAFPSYQLIFSGAVTLVNSANLILPGATNLSLQPNDSLQVVYLGAGVWQAVAAPSGGVVGEIRSFAMATCPTGWLEAAGQSVAATTYPNLFARSARLGAHRRATWCYPIAVADLLVASIMVRASIAGAHSALCRPISSKTISILLR
jgi:hypothetical protein